jgi:aspartate aminotransferase/aminotransferase
MDTPDRERCFAIARLYRGTAMIADRMKLIDASGIRKVFDLAAKLKDPLNLSIGQPDYDVPESVKEAAIAAIRAGNNKYTQTQGIGELRDRIAADLAAQFKVAKPNVLITSGTSGGLLLALMVTVNPGDEVLIGDPYFVMYKHLVNLLGGKPVFVDTYPDFRLTAERVRSRITPRTKILMLNSPCNPSGAVLTGSEIDSLLAVAREHKLLVLSDEIYDAFCYDTPYESAFGRYENVVLLKGFSKTWAMTGWRLGYATGPAEIMQAMTMLQQYSFVCAPSMVQCAGLTAIDTDMSEAVADFRERRDLIYNALKNDFEVSRPGGAFYIFPKAPGGRAQEFVAKAIERSVLIIPGNVFSERDTHFRISYAASRDTIRRGAEILCQLAREMA